MKKIRISTKKGTIGKKFLVFNSPESLYVWLHDPDINNVKDLDPSLGTVVHLRGGEVMEVEWRGFENVFEDNKLIMCANLIRLCKEINTSVKFAKPIVGIHEGWVTDEMMPFKTKVGKEFRTTLLTENSRHKFDLDQMFEEHPDDINSLDDLDDAFKFVSSPKQSEPS